jgi:uncharacterized repeat protein (TIGR01451 family)
VSEDDAAGYVRTISGDCDADGAVTLQAGDEKTCTITNDDVAPTLRVIKQVVNDDGGTKVAGDFSLHVKSGGADVASSPQSGSSTGTSYTLEPGTYGVSEGAVAGKSPFAGAESPGVSRTRAAGFYVVSESGGPAGYAASFSRDCDAFGQVSLQAGEYKPCTITNDDIAPRLTVIKQVINDDFGTNGAGDFDDIAPTLTVVKRVVNDNGGTRSAGDWTMHIRSAGSDVAFPGDGAGTSRTLKAGGYTVGESGPGGYTATISGDCAGDGAVTLAVGEAKTCTITNDDIAPPPPAADLRVAKTASDTTPFLGDTVGYTLTVSNAGPDTATAGVLTDDVDGRLAAGATPAGCSATNLAGGATRVRCALGDLGAGASRSVTLEVRPLMACTFAGTSRDDRDRNIGSPTGDDVIYGGASADTFSGGKGDDALYGIAPLKGLPGTVPNAASVTSATADPNPANNTSAASLTVVPGRDRGRRQPLA